MQERKGHNQKKENTGKKKNLTGKGKCTVITVNQPIKLI